jgi:hypothetical protein
MHCRDDWQMRTAPLRLMPAWRGVVLTPASIWRAIDPLSRSPVGLVMSDAATAVVGL